MRAAKILRTVHADLTQLVILTRHFFHRLFQNDVVAFEDQMRERLLGILALCAVLCGHVANAVLMKYSFVVDDGISWVEKCYVLSFFMVLMGLVAVLEWNVIFPDARDYANLIVLPIRIRTLFLGKFASLLLFVGMFSVGMNAFAVMAFSYHLPKWQSDSLVYGLRFSLVHLVSAFAAVFFMFFFIVFFIGLLMTLLGARLFSRLSVYLRATLLVIHIFLLSMFITGSIYVTPSFSSFLQLKAQNSSFLLLFPPMWFTGLYETLLGNRDLLFRALAQIAILALVSAACGFYLATALSYRRYLRKMAAVPTPRGRLRRVRSAISRGFDEVYLRNPIQRAVFHFFGSTLRRSMLHKMRLASSIAVGTGIILIWLIPQAGDLRARPGFPRILLAAPLVLTVFLLLGVRGIIKIPIAWKANWIFQLTEAQQRRHYFIGLRKAVFCFCLLPLFGLLFIGYAFLWGAHVAFYLGMFGLVLALLLYEIFFFKIQIIPFTCSYLPGREKVQYFWLVYFLAFLIYIQTMTHVATQLLHHPRKMIVFLATIMVMVWALRTWKVYFRYQKLGLKFDDVPEPVLVSLVPSE